MSGPLSGVRVLDLSTVLMGPFAAQMLGDMGADVIKIESPQGDVTRQLWPFRNRGMGHMFMNVNRNKRSIALDLKREEARAALLALVAGADVLLYNSRPNSMARLGLSYEEVREVNPRIIYVGAFGYSQRGQYAAKPAYEDLIQGAIGLPALFMRQGAEQPHYAPINLVDRAVGQQVASAVSAALYFREKSGKGQRIDIPMFEHMLAIVMGEHLGGAAFEPRVDEPGYSRILLHERRPFATSDGYICTLIYTDKHWRAFFALIGKPAMMDEDPRFTSAASRSQHYGAVNSMVAEELRKRSTAEWLQDFEQADIPAQRVNDLEDILADPHLAEIGYFTEHDHPTEGRIRTTAVPSEWSESKPEYRLHAPQLGEHTREILREAGLDEERIEALLKSGAARG
ncbi:CaiB/BaiF CoA transferase family protein [Lacisediminimonas profundi]|uniref:CaiB/BaiF CoA transferase family protein n=1 Tax=Lacisediminimonas profundi TaxID=2603856 RepID=UPI00124AFF40|nr:CoA transferase [Lacisediminimonas profundi]